MDVTNWPVVEALIAAGRRARLKRELVEEVVESRRNDVVQATQDLLEAEGGQVDGAHRRLEFLQYRWTEGVGALATKWTRR